MKQYSVDELDKMIKEFESSQANKQSETVDCEEEFADKNIKEVIKEGMDNLFGPN